MQSTCLALNPNIKYITYFTILEFFVYVTSLFILKTDFLKTIVILFIEKSSNYDHKTIQTKTIKISKNIRFKRKSSQKKNCGHKKNQGRLFYT